MVATVPHVVRATVTGSKLRLGRRNGTFGMD